MATHSFVFKLNHALPSGKEEHRRYGFSGDLRNAAVFTGLHDRVASVFNLDKDHFYLATSDHLGRQVRLQDHDSFLKHVCDPTLSEEGQKSIKLDDKQRIVLVFHVIDEQQQKDEDIAEAEDDVASAASQAATWDKETAEALARSQETFSAEQEQQRKKAAEEARRIASSAVSDTLPLVDATASRAPRPAVSVVPTTTESGPPAPPAVPLASLRPFHPYHPHSSTHHHHHASPNGTTGPGALGGPFHHHHLPSHAHAHGIGHSHAHSHTHHHGHASSQEGLTADRLSVMAKRIEMRRSMQERLQGQNRETPSASTSAAVHAQPEVVAPSSDGYHPSYFTSNSPATEAKAQEEEQERAKTPTQPAAVESPIAETWSGVKGLLKTFVRDLNRHLADNFGDDAAGFELSIPVEEEKREVKSEERKSLAEEGDERVVHSAVFCDRCLKTIIGVRHKCTGCSSYDLCTRCLPTRENFHNRQHVFSRIARPGAMPVVDSPPVAVTAQEQKPAPIVQPPTPQPQPPKELEQHPATCDACDKNIRGVRHKCLECPDYDMCSDCHTNVASIVHPLHNFFPIASPSAVPIRIQPGAHAIHHHIICDSCDTSPIIGVRYRCVELECGDQFDMCERCEADPVPRHPRSHQLLKIREPVKGGESATRDRMERARQIGAAAASSGDALPLAGLGGGIERILKSLGVGAPSTAEKGTSTTTDGEQGLPSWATVVEGPGGDRTVVIDVDLNNARAGQTPYDVEDLVRESDKEAEVKQTEADVEEQQPEQEEVVESEVEEEQTVEEDESFKATFVADVTLTDGSLVPSGGEFNKVWLVRNSGSHTWPEGTLLVNVGGFSNLVAGQAGVQQFEVSRAEPGECVEIQCELKAAEDDGTYMDFWRLKAPSGELFGDRLWVSIVVESDDAVLRNSGSSLNSSFVAPSMHASGKLQGPSTGSGTEAPSAAPSAMSSVAAPSVRSESIGDGEFESVKAEEEEVSSEEESSSEVESAEEVSEIDEDEEDFVVLTDSEDGDSSSEDEEWRE